MPTNVFGSEAGFSRFNNSLARHSFTGNSPGGQNIFGELQGHLSMKMRETGAKEEAQDAQTVIFSKEQDSAN